VEENPSSARILVFRTGLLCLLILWLGILVLGILITLPKDPPPLDSVRYFVSRSFQLSIALSRYLSSFLPLIMPVLLCCLYLLVSSLFFFEALLIDTIHFIHRRRIVIVV